MIQKKGGTTGKEGLEGSEVGVEGEKRGHPPKECVKKARRQKMSQSWPGKLGADEKGK